MRKKRLWVIIQEIFLASWKNVETMEKATELAVAKQQIPVKQSNAKEVTSRRVE